MFARTALRAAARSAAPRVAAPARAAVARQMATVARNNARQAAIPLAIGSATAFALGAYYYAAVAPAVEAENKANAGVQGTNKERTYIMIKPDFVQRGLVGEVLSAFERKGFKLVALKMMAPSKEHMAKHYDDLKAKPFFKGLVEYMSSGTPVVCMVWEGKNVIKQGRLILGATNPADSAPGTLRGVYATTVGRNGCHGSDSFESANDEIALWFTDKEICDWDPALYKWINE